MALLKQKKETRELARRLRAELLKTRVQLDVQRGGAQRVSERTEAGTEQITQ